MCFQLDGTGKNKGEYNLEGSPAKSYYKGDKLPDGTKAKENIVIMDATQWTQGMIPHELGHQIGKERGFTEQMYKNIYKKIESQVDIGLKEWISNYEGIEKGVDPETGKETKRIVHPRGSLKTFRDIIDWEYKNEDPNRRAEERVMNVVEFLTSKGSDGERLRSNSALGTIVRNGTMHKLRRSLKDFYEGQWKNDPKMKDKKIQIAGPHEVLDLLYRIGQEGGKEGYYKHWDKIKRISFSLIILL